MFVLGALLTRGAAWANENAIHACVNPAGIPRIVDGPGECKKNEASINWGAAGPAATQGRQDQQEPTEHPARQDRKDRRARQDPPVTPG